jgi:hypothetical protein
MTAATQQVVDFFFEHALQAGLHVRTKNVSSVDQVGLDEVAGMSIFSMGGGSFSMPGFSRG